MEDLASTIAALTRKKEEFGRSIEKATSLARTLEKNATEREQLIAEAAALNNSSNNPNPNNHHDHDDGAGNGDIASSLDTQAELEAKLKEQKKQTAYQKARKLAAERALSFLTNNLLASDVVPRNQRSILSTEGMVRKMASAKPPKKISDDVSSSEYWTFLPPWIPGITLPQAEDIPKTEVEMVLRIHARLSRDVVLKEDVLVGLMLISQLVSRLPSSNFHQIAEVYGNLESLGSRLFQDWKTGRELFLFAMHELGRLVIGRFGDHSTPPLNPTPICRSVSMPFCYTPDRSPLLMSTFALAVRRTPRAYNTLSLATLTWICSAEAHRREQNPFSRSFYHEPTSDRGWLCNRKEPYVLLIDFNKSSTLMVHKSLFSPELTDTVPGQPDQVDVHIKGPCEGDEGMWIKGAPLELRHWLGRYVWGTSEPLDDAWL